MPTLLKRVGNLISNTRADAQGRPTTTFAHLMTAPQLSSHGAWARSVLPALADAPAWSVLPGPGAPTLPTSGCRQPPAFQGEVTQLPAAAVSQLLQGKSHKNYNLEFICSLYSCLPTNAQYHSEKGSCVSSSFLRVGNSSPEPGEGSWRRQELRLPWPWSLPCQSPAGAGAHTDQRTVCSFHLSCLTIPLLGTHPEGLGCIWHEAKASPHEGRLEGPRGLLPLPGTGTPSAHATARHSHAGSPKPSRRRAHQLRCSAAPQVRRCRRGCAWGRCSGH